MLALLEIVVNCVSTRKIEEITYELCCTEFSKSTILELCKNIDPIVSAWNPRLLREEKIPFVIVDAIVIRVGEDSRVRQRGLLIAIGVNEKGCKEILGL